MKTALIVLLATVLGWAQPRMSPGAVEMAKLLRVEALLDQPTLTSDARLELTEEVLASSLEIDGVIAEIENEIARASGVRTLLEADRDRHIGLNTIANIITGGGV